MRPAAWAVCVVMALVIVGCRKTEKAATPRGQAAAPHAPAGWTTYKDDRRRFAIALPPQWKVVPSPDWALRSRIARERAAGHKRLAVMYASILSDPSQRNPEWLFHAFKWPLSPTPITTDVIVKMNTFPSSEAAHSAAVTHTVFTELAKTGRSVTTKDLALPAGAATRIQGEIELDPSYHGARTGFFLYLIPHKRQVVQIECRTDSRELNGDAPLFNRIAKSLILE